MKVTAILAAAGAGRRFKAGRPKALIGVGGKTILRHAFDSLCGAWPFEQMIVTAPKGRAKQVRRALGSARFPVLVIEGGRTRAISVRKALQAVSTRSKWVLIHDAARANVGREIVRSVLAAAKRPGAAIAALPVSSTVKRAHADGTMAQTLDRRSLYLAQTPQVFRKDLLVKRYDVLGKRAEAATDDASLFDGTPVRVKLVEDSPRNFKITTPEDRELFLFYLKNREGR